MISDRIYDDNISTNENFEYGYPHSIAPITFFQKDSENVVWRAYVRQLPNA